MLSKRANKMKRQPRLTAREDLWRSVDDAETVSPRCSRQDRFFFPRSANPARIEILEISTASEANIERSSAEAASSSGPAFLGWPAIQSYVKEPLSSYF